MARKSKDQLVAPFPYFGGKSMIADEVWKRFGSVQNLVDPFFGSGALLLAKSANRSRTETVNDKDGFVSCFWRSVQHDPQAVAFYADNPVNENDLHARHSYIVRHKKKLVQKLEGDPEYFDAKIAGYWCYGMCCWIGSGFGSGAGSWSVVDGELVNLKRDGEGVAGQLPHLAGTGKGVTSKRGAAIGGQLPHLSTKGTGVNKTDAGVYGKLPHLAGSGKGINRQLVFLGNRGRGTQAASKNQRSGKGINRQLVSLGNRGRGTQAASKNQRASKGQCQTSSEMILQWMHALADRMRLVRVACGDWSRVCTDTVTKNLGTTAIFLDPPYPNEAYLEGAERCDGIYAEDSGDVAHEVAEWAIANGDDPMMRIALCSYSGAHKMPKDWTSLKWKAKGGYAVQGTGKTENRKREVIYFSPHCLTSEKKGFFF